jgi:cytochrome P450
MKQDMEFEGYVLKAGNAVIAPTWLGHRDESVWSTPDHPSDQVWPERFLNLDSIKPGDFFPFGTGVATCPARNYAKQEILSAVALMLFKFEIQPLHFVNPDGSVCDRSPEPLGGEGMGSGRPDRDLLVRMRKRMI